MLLGCHSFRGEAACVKGQCLCKDGFCANQYGVCVDPLASKCSTDAQETCRVFGCPSSLGPTDCQNRRCYCKPGYCYNAFIKRCEKLDTCIKDSGGSCKLMACNENRGATTCVDGKCVCAEGYCAKDNGAGGGICELADDHDYIAQVAAVNQEHPRFPGRHGKVTSGLAFSGGGSRAPTVVLGAYRALEHLGIMPHIDAVSCVSGSCWAASIHTFADLNTAALLGNPTEPSQLTLARLDQTPPALGAAVTTSAKSFLMRALTKHLDSHRLWPSFVEHTILKPFGLDKKAFMAGSAEQVERIKSHNPHLAEAAFLIPRPDRPKVFVMNGALLSPQGFTSSNNSIVSLQMSPDYTGSPFWPKDGPLTFQPSKHGALYPRTEYVGGGFVESFAFGGREPRSQSGGMHKLKPPSQPFTLGQAVGISSVSPGAKWAQQGKMEFVVPSAEVWPVLPKRGRHQQATPYNFGDGGNYENSGLLALLQRGARKAALWIATFIPISSSSKRYQHLDFCKVKGSWDELLGDMVDLVVDPTLTNLFGFPYTDPGNFYTKNQIFAKEDLPPILCDMQKLKQAGAPVLTRRRIRVLPNSWWGIKGGHEVDLAIFYLEQCKDFEEKLPADTRKRLGPAETAQRTWHTSGELARYPHYKTQGQTQEQLEVTRLTNREVNLLAAQSEYSVLQNAGLFRDLFLR